MNRTFLLILAPLSLTACGSEQAAEKASDDGRSAKGEVLGGTISDDMLPLDTVKSQSPPLRVDKGDTAPGDAATGSAADTDAADTKGESTAPAEQEIEQAAPVQAEEEG